MLWVCVCREREGVFIANLSNVFISFFSNVVFAMFIVSLYRLHWHHNSQQFSGFIKRVGWLNMKTRVIEDERIWYLSVINKVTSRTTIRCSQPLCNWQSFSYRQWWSPRFFHCCSFLLLLYLCATVKRLPLAQAHGNCTMNWKFRA